MASGLVGLLLLVVIVLAVVAVVLTSRSAVGGSTPPRLTAPDPVLARVKSLAWDHRDLDTPLADALIEHLNEHERDPDVQTVRNQVGEIAWHHRETCPDLSVLVIDALRHPGA